MNPSFTAEVCNVLEISSVQDALRARLGDMLTGESRNGFNAERHSLHPIGSMPEDRVQKQSRCSGNDLGIL